MGAQIVDSLARLRVDDPTDSTTRVVVLEDRAGPDDDVFNTRVADAMAVARLRSNVANVTAPALDDCARVLRIVDELNTTIHLGRMEVELARVLEEAFAQTAARLNDLVCALNRLGLFLVPSGSDHWGFRWNFEGEVKGPYPDLIETVIAAFQVPGSSPNIRDA